MDRKVLKIKRTVPTYIFNETERTIINERIPYKLTQIVFRGKTIPCIEFQEDVLDVLDDIEGYMLVEANMDAGKRSIATRISTLSFQSIRELGTISGASLIDLANGIKIVGRLVALAVVVGLANIDINFSNRLIPLVRAI